jgi:hypothetical protein
MILSQHITNKQKYNKNYISIYLQFPNFLALIALGISSSMLVHEFCIIWKLVLSASRIKMYQPMCSIG